HHHHDDRLSPLRLLHPLCHHHHHDDRLSPLRLLHPLCHHHHHHDRLSPLKLLHPLCHQRHHDNRLSETALLTNSPTIDQTPFLEPLPDPLDHQPRLNSPPLPQPPIRVSQTGFKDLGYGTIETHVLLDQISGSQTSVFLITDRGSRIRIVGEQDDGIKNTLQAKITLST
ncbi:hypothetical protein DPEC_G00338350, partial [Dallia pectoralis]